jgi:hypothetical protein
MGSDEQLKWTTTARTEMPELASVQQPAASFDDWVAHLRVDIDRAKAQDQPVLIFCADEVVRGNNNFDDLKKKLLIEELHAFRVKGVDTHDSKLQRIATPRAVSICGKAIGRGADIRIPIATAKGLHVILASPDYREEMLQQIGRTGRMNRAGSFSIIFKKGDTAPVYKKGDTLDALLTRVHIHDMSEKFFLHLADNPNRRAENLWKFFWFQRQLRASGKADLTEDQKHLFDSLMNTT